MERGSNQQIIFRDHSSTHIFIAKKHFLKHHKSRSVEIPFERVSKNAFLRRRFMCLNGLQKKFVATYHLSGVLSSFLRTISKRRNKRECHTTLEKDFTLQKHRRWQFLEFDTRGYYHVRLSHKWELWIVYTSTFTALFTAEDICMLRSFLKLVDRSMGDRFQYA